MPTHTCPCGFEPKDKKRKDHLKQHQKSCRAYEKIIELEAKNEKMQSQLLKLTEIALISKAPDSSRGELLELANSQKDDLLAQKKKMLLEKEREIEALKNENKELKATLKRDRQSTESMVNVNVEFGKESLAHINIASSSSERNQSRACRF